METRRIALVTETFYPAVDGTTTTLKQLTDHLIDAGHEVLVVAPGPGLSTYRRSQVARIRPLDRPGRQVRDALARFEPDLVHAVSPGTLGRKALKHARRAGVPTVVVQHAPPAELTRDLWLAKVVARADRLVVTSDFLAGRLHELGLDPAVWEPGVDTRAFTPGLHDQWLHDKWSRSRSREGRRVVVGYAGSLHERHGVRRLVELADLRGVQLVVVGGGPQESWLRRQLPRARFTGALGTGDLATALASMDVVVHPGETETCCHTLREASASGVPVVAPRSGGAPRVVRDLETGLLYDPGTATGLRRAVDSVAGDRHRALLGARGRELSTRTWQDSCGELLVEVYAPLLGPGELAGRPRTALTDPLRKGG